MVTGTEVIILGMSTGQYTLWANDMKNGPRLLGSSRMKISLSNVEFVVEVGVEPSLGLANH
jgi:hypothetical protein